MLQFQGNGDVVLPSKRFVMKDLGNTQSAVPSKRSVLKPLVPNTMEAEVRRPRIALKPSAADTLDENLHKPRVSTVPLAKKPAAECKSPDVKSHTDAFNRKVAIMCYDEADVLDETASVHYARDILDNLKRDERNRVPMANYMADDSCLVDPSMRATLCDWLVDVQLRFELKEATLYLCFNLLDRFLAVTQVRRSELQIVGCACMSLASKYHDTQYAMAEDFAALSAGNFGTEKFLKCERRVAVELDFDMTVATPLSFAQRFIKFATYKLQKNADKRILGSLVLYGLEQALGDYYLAIGPPSHVAAAAVCFAMCATKLIVCRKQWDDNFAEDCYVGYSFNQLLPQMQRLKQVICQKPRGNATFRKFRSSKRHKVAQYSFKTLELSALS